MIPFIQHNYRLSIKALNFFSFLTLRKCSIQKAINRLLFFPKIQCLLIDNRQRPEQQKAVLMKFLIVKTLRKKSGHVKSGNSESG